jgi:deazaflavin-dependent oxidoreductase (nitroreductase family)
MTTPASVRGEELASRVGYPVTHPARAQRAIQALAATRPVAWALSRTLRPVDDLLRRTGTRVTVPSVVAGLPAVTLATTGARSGRPRPVPLIPVITPGAFAVLGTNFGGAASPAWAHNLRASPRAALEYGGRTVEVLARVLDGAERDALLAAAGRVYPGFPRYVARAAHRRIPVFALEAAAPPAAGVTG